MSLTRSISSSCFLLNLSLSSSTVTIDRPRCLLWLEDEDELEEEDEDELDEEVERLGTLRTTAELELARELVPILSSSSSSLSFLREG
jgi:hypothetical protein